MQALSHQRKLPRERCATLKSTVYEEGWPAHIKPYKVRQAVALDLLRRGADPGDVQAHLGHVSPETTRRAYAGVLEARAKQTSRRLEGRLGLVS